MPLHDWSLVEPGIFHDFHTTWIGEIRTALNKSLPKTYYALAEQRAGNFVSDVLTLQAPGTPDPEQTETPPSSSDVDVAAVTATPKVSVSEQIESDLKNLQRQITIRHVSNHRVVALLEIVSPANKDRAQHVNDFVHKNASVLMDGIHVLIIDLFSAGSHDPNGIHPLVRARLQSAPNTANDVISPRATLASYAAGEPINAYLEFPADEDSLKPMPIFLTSERHINVPLEETYQRAWEGMPKYWQNVLLGRSN